MTAPPSSTPSAASATAAPSDAAPPETDASAAATAAQPDAELPHTAPQSTPAAAQPTAEQAPGGPTAPAPTEPDLRHHGDLEVRGTDLVDLAVNVRTGTPPQWLRARLADSLTELAAYPDGAAARAAVAARHGVRPEQVLLTAGAAEAFVLLARALPVRQPLVVHPQFTEPEAALQDAGHRVTRHLLTAGDGFRLDATALPHTADLVVVGNPTNPTSVLHPAEELARLARPGRTLVVDEAFVDAVPGERHSLVPQLGRLPGRVVVLRSLTKTWGLAGLRIGYVLADAETVALLAHHQPLWPVGTPALTAAEACSEPAALAEAEQAAGAFAADRAHLLRAVGKLPGLHTATPEPQGPFLLLRHERAPQLRAALRRRGFAVRRGDTFPGLGPEWFRLAVRDRATSDAFTAALAAALTEPPTEQPPEEPATA